VNIRAKSACGIWWFRRGWRKAFRNWQDAYEAGADTNLTSPLRFRQQARLLRSMAASAALEFTQAVHETVNCDKEGNVHSAFVDPAGTAAQPAALRDISVGIWLPDPERESLESVMVAARRPSGRIASGGKPG
jgi:hypothetical protein